MLRRNHVDHPKGKSIIPREISRSAAAKFSASRIGCARMAPKRKDWQALVKGLLKAELKRRNLSYADLAEKLEAIGSRTTSATFRTRSRAAALRPSFSSSA